MVKRIVKDNSNDIYVDTYDNTQKFGNDDLYKSPFDTYIFNPINEKLVGISYKWGITPNEVIASSKIFEMLAIFFIIICNYQLAGITYLTGYIFYCAGGRLVREYNMYSNFGMIFDFNSGVLIHSLLFFVLLAHNEFYFSHIAILLILTYLGNIYYGFIRAIQSMKKYTDDNFYEQLKRQLELQEPKWLLKMFLIFHWFAYDCYRSIIHTYNPISVRQYMKILKYYDSGTLATVIFLILFFNLGQFARYTLPEILSFVNELDAIHVILISMIVSIVMYLHSGREKYIALNFIHYGGLILGLIIVTTSENNLTLTSGVILFTFHLCYDIDYRMIRQIYDIIIMNKKRY